VPTSDGRAVRGTNLSAQVPEKNLFVEDVVTALTGPVDARGNSTTALRDQMNRATAEFDQRTAEAFARSLLESLCNTDEIDVRRLEALLILGLAHPHILVQHRISLRAEGKRLATMLEHMGQHDRARCLNETIEMNVGPDDGFVVEAEESPAQPAGAPAGKAAAKAKPSAADQQSTEEQVAEFLARADKAAARGKTNEAIRWLQEVVALDRNRRDVVRMIRDLRWEENERKARNQKRGKMAAGLLVLCGLAYGVYWREQHIGAQYAEIPPAQGDLTSLRARLDALDALVDANHVWIGMPAVLREQDRLNRQVSVAESKKAEEDHQAALVRAQRSEESKAALSRGMLLAQQGHFEEALVDLRHALELSGPDWPERAQVEANVAAIEAWLKKTP
jgi:tetratricopeptide (TPR) repeat protein